MQLKLPKVIGHRGVKGYAPENTLVGFHTAADMGITCVEFDVKLTKDDVAIVFHDDDLQRITSLDGNIADFTYEQLQGLDAGRHFGASFSDEPIPTLEQVLELCINRELDMNIEIKPCPGREIETAEVVLDEASRIWPEDRQAPLISSFKYPCLETALEMIPAWPRGFLINEADENRDDNWRKMVDYLKPYSINCNGNAVSPEDISAYHDTGLPILAYTINDPRIAQNLFELGVTSVFSDVPDVIEDIL